MRTTSASTPTSTAARHEPSASCGRAYRAPRLDLRLGEKAVQIDLRGRDRPPAARAGRYATLGRGERQQQRVRLNGWRDGCLTRETVAARHAEPPTK